MGISERRACRAIGQPRSTQRHERKVPDDEERLTSQIVRLATQYGRYGYRRITALLRNDGWQVNHKRVERIWRREGLKVPQKQPKRGRLWLNDGSCIRLRPERKDHVWSYDMVMERTSDGRPLQDAGRASERRATGYAGRGESACGGLAKGLQSHQAAQLSGV